MKIKRLDISGFKSFVDRTTITFPEPITAIVGPNGCGKSNIVDAIRWVMGEQSAKHLRGRAMDDVIFAGSESRGPSGLAEVSLTFDTRALAGAAAPGGVPWGAVGPEEVVVTRRLYRAGDSEYLLGGVPCRLRDIVDFFLGTGVGSKAYAIIEQGRIGFIVSSRPDDRRGLFDEAAGITKYKAKKKVAEKRMDGTRQHLLRVSDIIGEIETRLRSLRLQAQKAERYKRYRAELKDLELWSASQRFLGLLAEDKTIASQAEETAGQHEREAGALSVEEIDVEAERLALTEEMAEVTAAKDEVFSLSNKAQLGSQRAQHYEDESTTLSQRARDALREVEELAVRIEQNESSLRELEGHLARFEEDAEMRRDEYQELERVHEGVRSQLASARKELDAALSMAAASVARMARLESEIDAGQARREDLNRRLATLAVDDGALANQWEQVRAEAASVEERLTVMETRLEALADRKQELESRSHELKGEVSRGEIGLETLREESHRRRSRLQSLGEIQARYESFQRGVGAIMKEYRSTGQDTVGETRPWSSETAIRGLVADIVQPPPDLETAVEAVLGDRLGNIIVESHDVGIDAIEFLKSRSEGRSSFIPVTLRDVGSPARGGSAGTALAAHGSDGLAEATSGPTMESLADTLSETMMVWPTGEGIRGPLLDLIGFDRQYKRVASFLLGDVLVVEDLRRALDLWRNTGTDKTIVTLDGEVIDPHGVVTGGSREAATVGVLSQKREIRELEEVVTQLDLDYQAALARHVGVKQQLADVLAQLEEVTTAARQDEMGVVSLRKDLDRTGRETQQLEFRRAQLAKAAQELRVACEQAERRLAEARVQLETDSQNASEADARSNELRTESTGLADRLDGLVEHLTELKIAASQADDRRAGARTNMERLQRELGEYTNRRARLDLSAADEAARAEVLTADALRLRDEVALWNAEAEERARALGDRQATVEERNALLSRREADLRAARSSVSRLSQELATLQLRAQEVGLKRSGLEEQILARHRDVVLKEVVFDYHLRAPVGAEEEGRMTELRGLIERMGEINLTAIEESEELQKRFDFLSAQKADLESAIAQLETAIEKINKASRTRFREVFDAVNDKFQEVFPRLFGGGKARLALTDESDLLETGVEIIASPPGKKIMQNIELLSGGEKALTAVSLLFAIFLVKPSPFCLLDEVDAPLDEANVGRFNQAVREMTDRSQFIIITHNRRTMEIADRLCGITMEEPGVSKLVAVNLRGPRAGRGNVGQASASLDERDGGRELASGVGSAAKTA